ncbi:MAG TPA: hypothetical protein VMZ51_08220 [Acidimicrobiales bacterium]|nr:hypothetical protein [Acidimicrobiales bacterium]
MLPAGAIVDLYRQRRIARGPYLDRMAQVSAAYDGAMVVPMGNLTPEERSAVPNLVTQGIDQMGMRVASVMPSLDCAPTKIGSRSSARAAADRRRVLLGWWEENNIDLKQRLRARYMVGYASAPVMLRPCKETNGPKWFVRDPLSCFPAQTLDPGQVDPPDVIFAYTRSQAWLRQNYPDAALNLNRIRKPDGQPDNDHPVTLIEYTDAHEISLIALGAGATLNMGVAAPTTDNRMIFLPGAANRRSLTLGDDYIALQRLDNRAGRCTALVPGRITMNTERGQFDGIIGMHAAQAMLFALEFRAVVDGVWPNEWLIDRPGESAKIVEMADGRKGQIGRISGGGIQTVQNTPAYTTGQMIDRLERNARVDAGLPPDFGGEAGGNVRTGRRAEALLSAVSDFRIQEAQNLFARSLQQENRVGIAIAKGYFAKQSRTFHVSWSGGRGEVTFTPEKLFPTDQNKVYYPFAGADVNNLVIGIGQRKGLGMMSTQTAMELDPYIEDPEEEKDRLTTESIDRALESSLLEQASTGAIPPSDLARIRQLVATDKMELADAVMQVQREAQERQSTTESPVEPGSPEAMPGLAQPGMGAEAGATVGEVDPSQANLASQLRALYPGVAASRQAAVA